MISKLKYPVLDEIILILIIFLREVTIYNSEENKEFFEISTKEE